MIYDPDKSVKALRTKALAAYRAQDFQDAIDLCSEALKHPIDDGDLQKYIQGIMVRSRNEPAHILYDSAKKAFDEGNFRRASDLCYEALSFQPGDHSLRRRIEKLSHKAIDVLDSPPSPAASWFRRLSGGGKNLTNTALVFIAVFLGIIALLNFFDFIEAENASPATQVIAIAPTLNAQVQVVMSVSPTPMQPPTLTPTQPPTLTPTQPPTLIPTQPPTPTPMPTPTPTQTPLPLPKIGRVNADRVRLRAGPCTTFEDVTRLDNNEEVEIVEEQGGCNQDCLTWYRVERRSNRSQSEGWVCKYYVDDVDAADEYEGRKPVEILPFHFRIEPLRFSDEHEAGQRSRP